MPAHAPPEFTPLDEIVRAVVSVPTAPYLEGGVRAVVRSFAAERGLACAEDAYGNVYVTYRRGRARRPLVLGAHMDHPGFVVTTRRGRTLELEFRGGLAASYGRGEPLRLYDPADGAELGGAVIEAVRADERGRIAGARARLDPGTEAEEGDLALWDVPACRIRGDLVHARQCDDLAGCAAVLATLDAAAALGLPGQLVGLFTRAEEVGLRGAAVASREGLLPANAVVVAVETSSLAGGRARQGAGPVIRVGDAIHVFSPRVTRWMTGLAEELAAEDGTFAFQRKLMDGGVTEATAYDLLGFETGAACVALGNYHNAGPRGRVAAETVHLGDLEGLVSLFLRMFERLPQLERALPQLGARFDRLGREARAPLRRSR
jgi:endoglucanase